MKRLIALIAVLITASLCLAEGSAQAGFPSADLQELADLEATILSQLKSPTGADDPAFRDRVESGMVRAAVKMAAGEMAGVRPWLASALMRATWCDGAEAAAPFMELGPQMRAYLAQPLARLALGHGAQQEAVAILAHLAEESGPWQVGVRCASVLAQLQVARGAFADALHWCEQAEDLLETVALGLERDLYACEIAGRRFETGLALGLMDQAARALVKERDLAARLVEDDQPHYQEAGRSYAFTAQIHGLDLSLAQQRFRSVARRCEARLAEAQENPSERTLLLMRHSTALAELVREDPEAWRQPALRAIEELLASGLGSGPELRATLVRALDVAPQHAQAESWLAQLRAARGALSLRERSDLVVLEVLRAPASRLAAAVEELENVHAEWLLAWSQVAPPQGGLGFLEFARRRRVVATLVEAHLKLDPEEGLRRGLAILFREQGLGSLTRELTAGAPPTLEESLRLLVAPGQALLAYIFGRDGGRLIVVDEQGMESAPLTESPGRVEALRRSLTFATSQGDGNDEPLLELSRLLLPQPLRERMAKAQQWNITGLDLLGQLPFARLRDERGPLGTTTALCMVPSLPLAPRISGDPRTGAAEATQFLLLTAPSIHPEVEAEHRLARIPWSAEKAKAIAGKSSRVLSRAEASFAELSAAEPGTFDALHLVCHGATPLHDGRGGLWFAPDANRPRGRVMYEDLETLRYPPLVVLSACGAGRSATRRGEDAYSHLGGACLKGGAQAVLLSPEPVLYETVRSFMPRFRRALASGVNAAEALRLGRAGLSGVALEDALAWKLVGVAP